MSQNCSHCMVFPHVLPHIEHYFSLFFGYAAVIAAHIYIYYLTTIQTAKTVKFHVFIKRSNRPLKLKMKTDYKIIFEYEVKH